MGAYDIGGTLVADMFKSKYYGKSLSILGDSISTYAGYIPSGNANFYTGSNCGVTSVNQTWWMRLINSLGMTLNLNNSWSASRVTTTNGDTSAGCMTRCQDLGTSPDVIIVYMGINDFNNEVGLGTYDGDGSFPTTTTTFREAYTIMLHKILTAYPTSELWCATLTVCEKNGSTEPPEKNQNNVLLDDFNKAIRELSQIFGAKVLDFAQCGLTHENLSTYMGDYEAVGNTALHPNADGHELIALQAIRQIDYQFKTGSGVGGPVWTDVTGTLFAGSTSITLSSANITTNSTLDVYTSVFGVNPTGMSVSTGSATLSFEARTSDLDVKVRIT